MAGRGVCLADVMGPSILSCDHLRSEVDGAEAMGSRSRRRANKPEGNRSPARFVGRRHMLGQQA